jgi:hypothetical protein
MSHHESIVGHSSSGNKLYLLAHEGILRNWCRWGLARADAKEVLILAKNSMTFELY